MIVGVTGFAQHGKDSLGQRLVERWGYERFAFADVLKDMALTLDPIVRQSYRYSDDPERLAEVVKAVGWDRAKQEPEVRRFLQVLGTEAVRGHLGEDVWIDALARKIEQSGARRVVVTDVRFPNEAQWVFSSYNGIMVRIRRLNEDGTLFDNGLSADHPSERHTATLPVHYEFNVSRGLSQLQDFADELAIRLGAQEGECSYDGVPSTG